LSLLKVFDDLRHEVEQVEPRDDFILEVVFEAIVVEVVDLKHLFFECVEGFFVESDLIDVFLRLGFCLAELDSLIVFLVLVECSIHFLFLFGTLENVVDGLLVFFHL
jgi:hypothetical protein